MVTIRDYINNCNFVINTLLDEQERIVLRNENKIVSLNVDAFQSGQGSDDKQLNNTNTLFDGVYSLATQLLNPSKRAGDLYTFQDTNDFISNLQVNLNPNLTKFDMFSTGTGTDQKNLFFKAYTNLFGLGKDNTDFVNYNIIYPELMQYIKKYL